MSALNETLPQLRPAFTKQLGGKILLPAIALSSFSALLLELALTRLFSVVLFYHFAFLAISIALLGLGAGGVFAHLWKEWLGRWGTREIAAAASGLSAIVIPVVLEIVLHVPVSLELSWGNFFRLTVIYACSAVSFFLTGLQFSVVFARESARIPRLYAADLSGGALACLGVVPVLNWIGGPNAILFAALIAGFAAVIWSPNPRARNWTLGLSAVLAFVIALNFSGKLADIVWAKGVRRQNVEFARWNAISRVEVDRGNDGSRVIVIDADANTYIMNADLRHWEGSEWQDNLMEAPPAVVNALRPHGDYAIIGPGGGVDVLRAVANGSPNVTGIEINPIIANTVMRDRYADFAQHLYERPEVHIHVGDGRSFIRNATEQYDVVQMTLVDTWASTAAGAFALSENSLYTTEAFREYFEHLKPDGIVAVTRWEFRQPREALRVVSVAMEALHQLGVADTSRNFVVVSDGDLNEDGIPVAVLAKKSAFTPQEEETVKQHLRDYQPLKLLYSPSEKGNNAFVQLIQSNAPRLFSATYAYNVTPVTDNAPFFFFTLKAGRLLSPHSNSSAMDWKVNLGVAVLGMLLILSVLAVLAFLVLPLLLGGGARPQATSALFYFVAVGLGYILVEVTFIQRFVLFLGHPTYALTVVVFLMLLSSGAGSLTCANWFPDSRRLWLPLLLIVLALLIYVEALPVILDRLVGMVFAVKLMVSAILLVPLGFAMGMPFPSGLRSLAAIPHGGPSSNANYIEWAWAMNAASSVLGSVLAIVIAIQFGLNVTLSCGALAYLLALLLRGSYGESHPRLSRARGFCYHRGNNRVVLTGHWRFTRWPGVRSADLRGLGGSLPSQKQLKWSQLKVGITVIIASITLAVLTVLMSGGGLFTSKITLKSYFDDANGLRVGAPVRLSGVDIGNVTRIQVVPNRPLFPVEVTMKVVTKYDFDLRKDSVTLLSTAGVLGETYLNIDSSKAKDRKVQDGDVLQSQEVPDFSDMVRSGQSTLQNMDALLKRMDRIVAFVESGQGSVGKLLYDPSLYNRVNSTVAEFQGLVNEIAQGQGSIGKLLASDELYQKANGTIDKVNKMIDDLNAGNGTAGKLLKDSTLYDNANQTVANIKQLTDDINAGKGALGKMAKDQEFANKLQNTMNRLSDLADRLDAGEGSAGKFLRDPALYNNTNQLLTDSQDLVKAIRQNPKKYLTIHLKLF